MVKAHVSAHELVAGRYRLLEVVHRETNHVCWYAEDVDAGRPRLVTRIGLPDGPAQDGPRRTTTRVLRTSELMGLRRPGRIATVIDAVEESRTLWTVTEWIDGTPLGELLDRQGAFPHVQAARIGLELLDMLDAAHAEGLTHAELSPGQVYVRDQGPVVVAGFGLAGATLAPRLTAPSYASPEQARDERVGPAADLWALGAILYTMVEGRPPFRDRGRPEATLKGVDRLPVRTPLRAGPLTSIVQGLLRRNSQERPTRPMVREALSRVLAEAAEGDPRSGAAPRRPLAHVTARDWSRRTVVAGTALAAVTVSVAVLAAAQGLPDTSAPRAPSAADPTGAGAEGNASPTPAPSTTTAALPAGYRRRTAPEGFSVALPGSWKRLNTTRAAELAYRVTYGPGGDDPRTLAVTYSERVGPDPVAVWRDDVQPGLERLDGFRRIGDIRATTYQGHAAADMEWVSGSGNDRVRTLGRGFLLGDHRGFSLRFTAPARDWDDPADALALKTFLRTFRETAG